MLGAIVGDACYNLALCQEISEDPRHLGVRADATGWQIVLTKDGKTELIGLERFEDVWIYWSEFVGRHLADAPTIQRAA